MSTANSNAQNQIQVSALAYAQAPIAYDQIDNPFFSSIFSHIDPNRDGVIEPGMEAAQAAYMLHQMDMDQDGIVDVPDAHLYAFHQANNASIALKHHRGTNGTQLQDNVSAAQANLANIENQLTSMFEVENVDDISVAMRVSNPQARALYNQYNAAKHQVEQSEREVGYAAASASTLGAQQSDMMSLYYDMEFLVSGHQNITI
mgnify:CR=1 FL=1